jgi:TonB family protein
MPALTEFVSVSFAAGLAIKSVAVLAVAWLARWALQKQSAAVRHALWATTFVSLAGLLLFSAWLPALDVKIPARLLEPATLLMTSNADAPNPAGAAEQRETSTVKTSRQGPRPSRPSNMPIGMVLLLLWGCGFAACLAPVMAGWIAMWRMRRAANPLESAELTELARQVGLEHEPLLLEGEASSMPMTVGLFHPAVFLPRDAREWGAEQRRAVLLHELAHVRRGDSATHLLARMVVSFYWWNPLAWIAWREFVKERERPADDLVLAAGSLPTEYAQHLLDIARAQRLAMGLGAAAVAMARRSQLEGRLFAILDSGMKRTEPRRRVMLAAGVLALALVVPLAAMRVVQASEQSQEAAVTFRANASSEGLVGSLATALPADLDAMIGKALAEKQPPAVLDQLADKAAALGQFDAAQKLLEGALELRAGASGESSPTYGVGLSRLGDLFRSQGVGKNEDAKKRYTEAAALLTTGPEAATTLMHLGTVDLATAQQDARSGKPELANREYAEAIDHFEQARAADAVSGGEAAMWEALTARSQGDTLKADELFRQALSRQRDDPTGWLPTAELYAQLVDSEGDTEQAKALREQAAEIRKNVAPQVLFNAAGSEAALTYTKPRFGTPPRIESKIEPQYSADARIAKYQGAVVARVEIGSDGFVHSISIQRGLGLGLDEKAAEAIVRWKFKPAEQNGKPVAVQAVIEVNFRLL